MTELSSHHVGVVVSDLEESVSFYRDVLGLEVIAEFTLSGEGIGRAIDEDGVTGDFVHLDAGGTRVELIEYDPVGEDAGPDAINQVGAAHLGFEVEDVEAFQAGLPDDVETVSDPQEVDIGIEIMFFRDPDGNFVEVLEG